MRITIAIALIIAVAAHDANARSAVLNFSPDSTNQYGYTVRVNVQEVADGIQCEVTVSSSFTNVIPKVQDARVSKLSSGELPPSAIIGTNGDSWSRFVFTIPTNDLGTAEFGWSRPYTGFYKKLGGAIYVVNLKKYYDYSRATTNGKANHVSATIIKATGSRVDVVDPHPQIVITADRAITLARQACKGVAEVPANVEAVVTETNGSYVITFPQKLPEGTLGGDFYARVLIDKATGKVVDEIEVSQ